MRVHDAQAGKNALVLITKDRMYTIRGHLCACTHQGINLRVRTKDGSYLSGAQSTCQCAWMLGGPPRPGSCQSVGIRWMLDETLGGLDLIEL